MHWWCFGSQGACAADSGLTDGASGANGSPGGPATAQTLRTCVDLDRDGYGRGCEAGTDCDDHDPTRARECGVKEGGACTASDAPRPCYAIESLTTTNAYCQSGVRTCKNGVWGACVMNSAYTIPRVVSLSALIAGPTVCNPCDPACRVSVNYPDSGDLSAANSSGVQYDPGAGGVVLPGGVGGVGLVDSDGDGVPDPWDAFPSDPTKNGYTETGGIFHVLPYQGPAATDPLELTTNVRSGDVYFLMDTTGSMQEEINGLKAALTSKIIPRVGTIIPDVQFGAGYFDDYPEGDYGNYKATCNDAATNTQHDLPYFNLQNITGSAATAQAAVNRYVAKCGGDDPESYVSALYSIASGRGLPNLNDARTWVGAPQAIGPEGLAVNVVGGETQATAYDVGVIDGTWKQYKSTTVGMVRNYGTNSYPAPWPTPTENARAPDAVYKFQLNAASKVHIHMHPDYSQTGNRAYVCLHNASFGIVRCATYDDGTTWNYASNIVTNLAAGTYYVVAAFLGNTAGPYYLGIGTTNMPGEDRTTPIDAGDVTNTFKRYTSESRYWVSDYPNPTGDGTCRTNGGEVVVRFNITAPTWVYAGVTSAADSNSDPGDFEVELRDASWNPVTASHPGACWTSDQAQNQMSELGVAYLDYLQPGTYYAVVARQDIGWYDSFNFEVGSIPTWYTPPAGACANGGVGYPCFRKGSIPIVLVITDVPPHNFPGRGWEWYDNSIFRTQGSFYEEALPELQKIGAKVMGIGANAPRDWRQDYDCRGGWTPCTHYANKCEWWSVCTGGGPSQGGECHQEWTCFSYCDVGNECIDWGPVRDPYYFYSGGEAQLRQMARDTGAVDKDGNEFFYRIDPDSAGLTDQIADAVVQGIADLSRVSLMDITLRLNDDPSTAAVDERAFVLAVSAVPTLETDTRCRVTHATWFEGCLPGTKVKFNVTFKNDFVMHAATAQTFRFSIDTMGDALYLLGSTPVTIVVPPSGVAASYPPTGRYWQDYDSTRGCSGLQIPDWRELSWTASFPSDTYIAWELRTGDTQASLDSNAPVSFVAPATTSPVQVGERLAAAGLPRNARFLRVAATLHASTDLMSTPVLSGFELKYQCLESE